MEEQRSPILAFEADGAGVPIVFVHGFPMHREIWRPAASVLLPDHRCILPDLPGFGQSPLMPGVSLAAMARAVIDLVVNLGASPAVVVGLSMGGLIALEIYRHCPHAVTGLVLTGSRANAETPEGMERRREAAAMVRERGVEALLDSMAPGLFSREATDEVKGRFRAIACECGAEGVAAGSLALGGRADCTSVLETIGVPTLLIYGRDDVITPPELGEEMHRQIRGSRLEVVPGAGHMAPMERPEVFAALIRDFVRTTAGPDL